MKILKSLIIFLGLILALNATAFADFNDVDDSELYRKAIEFLQETGIVNGYADGTYRPDNEVNRAEMLKIVFEAVGIEEEVLEPFQNQSCFSDVPAGAWFTKYVCYAKSEGYVDGYADGSFRPANPVNIVEAVKIVLEVFGIEYEEDEEIWYRGIINAASAENYIPMDVTSFDGNLRRNQMADLITRVLKDQQGELADYLGPRSSLTVTFDTIDAAMNDINWDFDPNNNALVATTILSSNFDHDRVLTILQILTEDIGDPSLQGMPLTFLYSGDTFTYYYTSSITCILSGDCSEELLSKLDYILFEVEQITATFDFEGEGEMDEEMCYYISELDFSLDFPANPELDNNWAPIWEFVLMDQEYWGFLGSYQGQGVICDNGAPLDQDNLENPNGDKKIILEAKEAGTPQEELEDLEYALDLWLNAPEDDMIFGNPTMENYEYYLDWLDRTLDSVTEERTVNEADLASVQSKLDQFLDLVE